MAHDNRRFINAVGWILRTGAPWRDWPPSYGDWKNTHRRFCRWRDSGAWEALLEHVSNDPDYEGRMSDASPLKGHPHAAGTQGGTHAMSLTNGGSTPRSLWPAFGMLLRVLVTQGTTAECTQAAHLIEGSNAEHLWADQGYDRDTLVEQATVQGRPVVIPPRKHRTEQRRDDPHLSPPSR